METYYGVYRVLKGGKHRYVSRSATANKRLAESIAEDLSRGEIVTPTGATKHVTPYPHIAKEIETTKKNPRTVESGELAIYAINNSDLYRQRTVPILNNLKKKIAKGKYDKSLALKLWKYAADDAAQRYAKEFGGVWHEIFSVADRKEAAREMADHYAEELKENPRRKINARNFPYVVQAFRGSKWVDENGANTYSEAVDGENELIGEGFKTRILTVEHKKRGKVTRLRGNPATRIRRPAQKRRRSGFPGYIVTFIRRGKRMFISGMKPRYTVGYMRKAASVFSTSDKAKNVVRNNRKWFDANGVAKVTILQSNEDIRKF